MALDPKRIMCEVVGRLGRETQFHLDERHRHFHITNVVLIGLSVVLAIVAVFNFYYVQILYQDLNGIVNNMDSMHNNLKGIEKSMVSITGNVESFDRHMLNMDQIHENTTSLAGTMPRISQAMNTLSAEIGVIEQEMRLIQGGMINVDQRFGHMTSGVAVMRENVHQISGPMGFMNPFMP